MSTVVQGTPADKGQSLQAVAQVVQADARFLTQPQGSELLFASLQHGEYRFKTPVLLRLSQAGDAVSVVWTEGHIETKGRTTGEALEAFRNAVLRRADDPGLERYIERYN